MPSTIVRSPGRINLIGEHTDYTGGLVFPGAIDLSIYFAIRSSDDRRVRIIASDIGEQCNFDCDDLDPTDHNWINYVKGILSQLKLRGCPLSGFRCVMKSSLPLGSGVSSSAALECGILVALDHIWSLGLDRWEMIDISHRSNHDYLGVKSGILDQFAVLFGRKSSLMQMHCQTKAYEYVHADLKNYTLVLINTNVKHSNVDGEYNSRPGECQEALKILHKAGRDLGSLSSADQSDVSLLRAKGEILLAQRLDYIVEENKRVTQMMSALELGDLAGAGKLLYESHEGLSHLYEVSCPELDFLVDCSRQHDEVLGARMMGGGFGGCTLNLVRSDYMEAYLHACEKAYCERFGFSATPFEVALSDGTHICE